MDPGGLEPGGLEPGGLEPGGLDPGGLEPGGEGDLEPGIKVPFIGLGLGELGDVGYSYGIYIVIILDLAALYISFDMIYYE